MKSSIFQRTILIIFVSFFLVQISIFGVIFYTSVETVKDQTISSAESNIEMIRTYLDMIMKQLTDSMYIYVKSDVLLSEDREEINNFIEKFSGFNSYISCVMLLDGDEVLAISNPLLISNRIIDTKLYYEMSKKNRLVLTTPYYSTPLAGRAIALIRSLVDEKTGRERLLVAEIRPQNIFVPISNKLTSEETLIVLTQEGDTVYFDYNSLILGQIVSNDGQLDINENLREELNGLKSGIVELELNEKPIIVKRLRFNQYWKLYILAEFSLFYKAMMKMLYSYKLIGAVALILLALVSVIISNNIIHPVKELSLQVDSLSPKSDDLRLAVNRKDEIGRLATSFNNLLNRLQEANREKAKMERLRLELEYKVLQSQIQPHFLLNIHMCISSLLEQGKTEDARRMLLALDSLLRVSTDKIDQKITLKEEIDTIKQYVILQKMRLGDTFDIYIGDWESYAGVKVPKLLLQPIVENSIYHGFAGIERRGEIKISFTEIDSYLHVVVEDNGCGIPSNIIKQKTQDKPNRNGMVSIGIDNVRQRIKNLYGEDCGLYISSRENIGTRVEIVIHMQN